MSPFSVFQAGRNAMSDWASSNSPTLNTLNDFLRTYYGTIPFHLVPDLLSDLVYDSPATVDLVMKSHPGKGVFDNECPETASGWLLGEEAIPLGNNVTWEKVIEAIELHESKHGLTSPEWVILVNDGHVTRIWDINEAVLVMKS